MSWCIPQVYAVELAVVSLEKITIHTVKMVVKIALQKKEKAIFEESMNLSHNDSSIIIEQQKILFGLTTLWDQQVTNANNAIYKNYLKIGESKYPLSKNMK